MSNLRVKTKEEMIQDFGPIEIEYEREYWRFPGKMITFERSMFRYLGQQIPISENLYLLMLGLKEDAVLFQQEPNDIQSWHFTIDMITNI